MIELANAPKPKPLPAATPPVAGQPVDTATLRNLPVGPARAATHVQPKPVTSFGRRS